MVDYFWAFYRLQTIYRLAHGGPSYKIDIYLRNWSIRTELQRRAYLYNIENESFSQPELNVPTEQQRLRNGEISSSANTMTTESLSTTAPEIHPMNFSSGPQQTYANRSNTPNNDNRNHNRRVAYQHGQQRQQQQHHHRQQEDLLYQKQYCNEIKVIQSDLMRSKDVDVGTLSEINTTERKHTTVSATAAVDNLEIELIADRCDVWRNKHVRNFSVRKATLTPHIKSRKPRNAMEKTPNAICPFTAVTKCESGKAAKPAPSSSQSQPKLKTQNTLISRLLLADILENI